MNDDLTPTQAAARVSKGGTDFSPWSAYKMGRYRAFLERAQVAYEGYWPRFDALEVWVRATENRAQALHRTLLDEGIKFPLTLCTHHGHWTCLTEAEMPLTDKFGASGEGLVIYYG